MARMVLLQFAAALVVALVAVFVSGLSSGISALLGGLSCAIPNALFALRLNASAKKPGGGNPMNFFIGEFIKIGSTIALMMAVVWLYRDLHWVAFIAGIVVILKSYFILLFRHKL
ncbi:MAG: ATP synthase subunit I [Undibacterium sp.]|jgi:ATP synthase protein I|nr:ATP synthase subunit I [Undibacterium sp.]MDO8701210.1 ATP synthase subunit I [Undibacterium sp.]MDO9192005.1 ATP synthase subunit I [Undibacterium sp.]